MKEITVLSGKGGAGKTSVTAALMSLAQNTVFCDNDVDAANLHLLANPQVEEEYVFEGARLANIDSEVCIGCGECVVHCKFHAVVQSEQGVFSVNPFSCEGCRLCERLCPVGAISSTKSVENKWFVSSTRYGKMVHAKMKPGEENSGKLVTKVRQAARELAEISKADYVINDGPPGIGCTAISSITGTDAVLIVIEPSKSGLHDAKRLVTLAQSFNVKVFGVINKYNISLEQTDEIRVYLNEKNIPLLSVIPFDEQIVKAMLNMQSIVEYAPDSASAIALNQTWTLLKKELDKSVPEVRTNKILSNIQWNTN